MWKAFWPKNLPWVKALFVLSLVCLITNKVLLVSVPFLFKEIINLFDGKFTLEILLQQRNNGLLLLLIFILVRLLAQILSDCRDLLFSKISQRVLRNVGLQVFEHIHKLSLSYHLSRKTGGLSRIIERGTKGIESFVRFMTFNLVPTFFEIFLVAGIFIYFYTWPYALVTVITLILYMVFTIIISQWRIGFVRQMNTQENHSQSKAIDSLLNYETVKYFNNEKHEAERFDEHLKIYEKIAFKTAASLGLLNFVQNLIMMVGLGIVLMLGIFDLSEGKITLGDFVAMHGLLLQVYIPLSFFGFSYRETKMALVNIEDMVSVLDEKCDIQDKIDATPLQIRGGEICFDHVSFGYESSRMIIKDLNLTVPAGSTLAIVGSSGAGKSTLARLLYRFYDLNEGKIRIDGQDISEVTQESLRNAIGIVPQDTVLFNDTIGYNIGYGRPNTSSEAIEKAAKKANISDFVNNLPEGYNTLVGERGLKLSGGEKQRVSIARTLIKDPTILIFDEATSALDTKNEKVIQKHLNELSKNHTTIIVAHRLSTVVDADNIIVLNNGIVIESGTHYELIRLNGYYAEMWSKQKTKENNET